MKTLQAEFMGDAGSEISARAWRAMQEGEGGPTLVEDWARILFIHYEVDPAALQPQIPYRLDTFDGRAFVSLTAFYGHGLRPVALGAAGRWLAKPGQFPFILNVRTYVRHEGESGIYFLAEWIPNRLAAFAGRTLFGLPFRHGRLEYRHDDQRVMGRIENGRGPGAFRYEAQIPADAHFTTAVLGSRTEWLLERYTAFTHLADRRRFFRVWHPAWPQTEVAVRIADDSLLRETGPWFEKARLLGANYSPGFYDVHMGRAQRLRNAVATTGLRFVNGTRVPCTAAMHRTKRARPAATGPAGRAAQSILLGSIN